MDDKQDGVRRGDVEAASVALPSRDELDAAPRELLKRGRSMGQPDTLRVEWGGGAIVVKDMRPRPAIVRAVWGRWVLRRELEALRRAEPLGCAPRALGMIDADALAMEFVAAPRLPKRASGDVSDNVDAAFFDRLEAQIDALHAAGLAHGDLRRTNILVAPGGRPLLLDFASATVRPPMWRVFALVFYSLQQRADRHLLGKIRHVTLHGKEGATAHYPWYMKLGRVWKKGLYRPIKAARERLFGAPRRDDETPHREER